MTCHIAKHFFAASIITLAACADRDPVLVDEVVNGATADSSSVSTEQRTGDPVRGRSLLLNNGTPETPYLSCGIPRSLIDLLGAFGIDLFADSIKLPERDRVNADLAYNFSSAKTPAGVDVVTTNCLLCHASKLGDSLIIGLGNPNADFTGRDNTFFGVPSSAVDLLALTLSPWERRELTRFNRISEATAGWGKPDTIGLNPADVMFGVLASHRDPVTLEWIDEADPNAGLGTETVFTDVPAWWNMHRRERMFFSGFGRGDHARIMMTAALLCLEDKTEAEAIDAYFPDIQAFILSLRAPKYQDVAKRPIDAAQASAGREIFVNTCSRCHGDAETGTPPRINVSVDEVGTDPVYAIASSRAGTGAVAYYFDFFNRSWYGTHGAAGHLEQEDTPVYAPPPLDGVWATAPYFHNGSVPTLEAVLDPSLRPTIFRRSFKPEDYDFQRLGWPFEEVARKSNDAEVYDTTRAAYSNTGHTFAAGLTPAERRDLLEYLKTL